MNVYVNVNVNVKWVLGGGGGGVRELRECWETFEVLKTETRWDVEKVGGLSHKQKWKKKKKKGHMISWPLPREERERESLDDKMNLTKLEKEKKSCFEKQQTVASA